MPMASPPRRRLNVLLPTLGSAGDVHPFIALGLALKARGHRATLLTNPYFQSSIEAQGLGFLAVGSLADVESALADPDLWHSRRGFQVIARRLILPSIETVYRHIESHADTDTVVAASSISFGARIAQERLGVPTASIHLQPTVIRSLIDSGMFGDMRISAAQPAWFKRALFRFIDWAAIDRILGQPLNEFRATLGLPPVRRILARWLHSPECVIGFFPDWFAAPQADWPAHTHLVGFPLWDGSGAVAVPNGVQEFLRAGAPPIVFTPGSAAAQAQRFFAESIAAVRRLGARAMLVTNFLEQVPQHLPPGVEAFGYVPFSEVLPHAAALAYHGGIGTLAQGVKAGIPHLAVPSAHDQFDNGWRIVQLGLGRSVPERRYRAAGAAAALAALLDDAPMHERCRVYAGRVDGEAALRRACELIEALAEAHPR
jgi:rhamnosyltransferase subunit B